MFKHLSKRLIFIFSNFEFDFNFLFNFNHFAIFLVFAYSWLRNTYGCDSFQNTAPAKQSTRNRC